MRRRRRRRVGLSSVHGFTLRASPAVKYGVSPPGTVGEHEGRLRSTQSPHITSSASTSTQSNASGGGAPCVTAGDTRAKRGGTRGQADYSDPDAGGVALKAWRSNSDVQKRAAVRRRRRRSSLCSLSHGFALRASPAVKPGVSPLGTVGEYAVLLGKVDAIRVRAEKLILFSNTISA